MVVKPETGEATDDATGTVSGSAPAPQDETSMTTQEEPGPTASDQEVAGHQSALQPLQVNGSAQNTDAPPAGVEPAGATSEEEQDNDRRRRRRRRSAT